MNEMNITSVQYVNEMMNGEVVQENVSITAVIDGIIMSVPLDPANRHYAGIVQATAYDGSFWGDSVPEPMATEAADWLFNKQLQDYTTAVARLAQYQVALGREEVTEMQDTTEQQVDDEGMPVYDEDYNPVYVQQEVVVVSAIEPVEPTVEVTVYSEDMDAEPTVETIENPLITQDNAERQAAQAVVDATPEAVVAAYQA
jgi:hypothetical protein